MATSTPASRPGFLTDCRMDGPDARIAIFGNGMVAKELIIDHDKAHRVSWSATGGRLTHHNASMQIFADGDGTKAVWIADLLPKELAGPIGGMIEQELGAMGKTLGS